MDFKEIKEIAYYGSTNLFEGITKEESLFVYAVKSLYSEFYDGEMTKEEAEEKLQDFKSVYENVEKIYDVFTKMVEMIGKKVNFHIKTASSDFSSVGEIKSVRVFEGNIFLFEVVEEKSNTVYTIGKENILEE